MGSFTKLIRFKSENGGTYYADLGSLTSEAPTLGLQITAYNSFEDLLSKSNADTATVKEVRRQDDVISPIMERRTANSNLMCSSSLLYPVVTYQSTAWD